MIVMAGQNQSNISSNIFSACLMKCWMKKYVFHMTNFLVWTRSSNIPSNILTFIHSKLQIQNKLKMVEEIRVSSILIKFFPKSVI